MATKKTYEPIFSVPTKSETSVAGKAASAAGAPTVDKMKSVVNKSVIPMKGATPFPSVPSTPMSGQLGQRITDYLNREPVLPVAKLTQAIATPSGKRIVPTNDRQDRQQYQSPSTKGILESAFDKENYAEKFKRGDVGGGVANLLGTVVTAPQSLYLNLLNAGQDVAKGKKPSFQYQMGYSDYEKKVADRQGTIPLSQKIENPLLQGAYRLGMEVVTDPLELTPIGFYNDIKLAKGASQATGAYAESLQAGKLVPRVNGAKQANANTPNRPVQPRTPQNRTVVPDVAQTGVKQAENVAPVRRALKQSEVDFPDLPIKKANIKNEARNKGTHIEVGEKFEALSPEHQQSILVHENAHNLSNKHLFEDGKFQDILNNKAFGETKITSDGRTYWEGIFGDVGATSVDETLTEAIAIYKRNPEWLLERHPKAYAYIKNNVMSKPFTTPRNPLNRPVQPRTPQNRTVVPDVAQTGVKQAENVAPVRRALKQSEVDFPDLPIKKANIKNEARNKGTHIEVGEKFEALSPEHQQSILVHENAHNLSNKHLFEDGKFQDILNNKAFGETKITSDGRTYWEGIFGDVGATSVDETLTEAIAIYKRNPEWLLERHPKAYAYIKNNVMSKPFTTPRNPLNRPVQPRTVTIPIKRQTPAKNVIPVKGQTPSKPQTPQTPPQTPPSNTGNLGTARTKINYSYSKKSGNLWERIRTQFTDDLAPLENVEKQIRGKIPSAENSLYKQARLSKGIPEKANLIIRNELKPIIKKIEDAGHSYQDLGLYAEAVHARDVNRAGLKSGFTDAEIDDVIRQLGSTEMESARKELVAYSGRRLDSLADAGVITRKEVDAMRKKWKNYMPLNRAFDDDKIEFANGLSKAFVGVSSPIKALKGSDRQIIDPIESLVRNTYKAEQVAGRNIVGRQLTSLAQDDATGAFVRQLAKGEEVGRKNVVNILENGKKVHYEVTPEVYKALKDMNKETSNLLIKAFQTPASILRAGAVLTPEFAMRNPMRDVMQAFINSESGFNPITDFAYGLASYIKRGNLYQAFLKNNAGYGNIISMDRKLHKNTIESMLKKTPTEKVINVVNPQTWLRVLRNISDATESATKIGEFRAALRSGATAQEAAYRARDLMDFARAGSSVRQVNKVVAFLNANIQGKSKLIRSIKRDPVGVGARMVGSMAVPSIGAYYLNNMLATEDQKATIKDAPDWLRDTFWLIAVPGTDTVVRIPKPFEGAAVSNVIERFMQYMADNDPEAFDGFLKATVSEQSLPVMLSGLTPIIEGMTNYSFFRQSPIVPEREKYLEKKDQYDIYTSEVAKAVASVSGKVLGEDSNFASPRITDNAIKGITAGLGTYATDAVDAMIGKNKPAKNVEQLPLIKAFTVNPNSTGKAMDFVYTEYNRLNKQKNSAKKNEGTFTQEKNLKILKEAKDKINDISKQIREIQNDPDMSPETKRNRINALSEKRNKIARDTKAKMSVIPTK